MFDKEELLDICFEVIKECMDTITLPTGKTLLPTFVFSLLIFVISLICKLLGYLTLVRWQGALIATILLGGLCFIEYQGEKSIKQLYEKAKKILPKAEETKES